jgi:hypothetical protein
MLDPNQHSFTFLEIAQYLSRASAGQHSSDELLQALAVDALTDRFPADTVGHNVDAHLRQAGAENYPYDYSDPELILDRRETNFEPITPLGIARSLALYAPESDSYSPACQGSVIALNDLATRMLPPPGTHARVFIESLALTKVGARKFCDRYHLAHPHWLEEPEASTMTDGAPTDHCPTGESHGRRGLLLG